MPHDVGQSTPSPTPAPVVSSNPYPATGIGLDALDTAMSSLCPIMWAILPPPPPTSPAPVVSSNPYPATGIGLDALDTAMSSLCPIMWASHPPPHPASPRRKFESLPRHGNRTGRLGHRHQFLMPHDVSQSVLLCFHMFYHAARLGHLFQVVL